MLLRESLEMVTSTRVKQGAREYRSGHGFGETLQALSTGLAIETEPTVDALRRRLPIVDLRRRYVDLPACSASKLMTMRDGIRVLNMIAQLFRGENPMQFFSAVGLLFAIGAVSIATRAAAE